MYKNNNSGKIDIVAFLKRRETSVLVVFVFFVFCFVFFWGEGGGDKF